MTASVRTRGFGLFALAAALLVPGWAAAMPLRDLMKNHEQFAGTMGKSREERIRASLQFARQLHDGKANYFRQNAALTERLEALEKQNPRYLAHEYFNRDWTPMYFNELAQSLAGAKLTMRDRRPYLSMCRA